MTELDLLLRQRQLCDALIDVYQRHRCKGRDRLSQSLQCVENHARQGLAAVFLLEWLWSLFGNTAKPDHPFAAQVEKLLAEYHAANPPP